MRIEMYGLAFETPAVMYYLWSPWRCTAIEHRLFEGVKALDPAAFESAPDEWHWSAESPRVWQQSLTVIERILKGWQEEGTEAGGERRSWRWLLEADTDTDGYDHSGEQAAMWAFVRLSVDRNNPGEADKSEDLDLSGLGVRIANVQEG